MSPSSINPTEKNDLATERFKSLNRGNMRLLVLALGFPGTMHEPIWHELPLPLREILAYRSRWGVGLSQNMRPRRTASLDVKSPNGGSES